jgi:CRP-like cAMP-binding protein
MLEKGNYSYPQGEPFLGGSNVADHPSTLPLKSWNHFGGMTVERSPLFSGILPEDYARISAGARIKAFARDQMLHFEGDTVEQVILLTSGFVKLTQFGSGGAEVILRIGMPGDVLGAMGLFSGGKQRSTAQTLQTCRALVWNAQAFKTLVEHFPVLHKNMVRILGKHLLELEERFREVATERVGPRVARQLVRLLEQIGPPESGEIEIGLSREELGQMTGTTLFTVSRLLSSWEARGIVRNRRKGVTICDVRQLRAESE